MSCSDNWYLKLVREVRVSSFRDFLQYVPVIGSRELEGKVAKVSVRFLDDQ